MELYAFTDEEYGKVLDNIVVGCVDVAVVHGSTVLLEKRRFDPIKDEWWIFGGRILVGEELKEAAQRSLFRELGLQIEDTDRFMEVGVFNLRWPTRREPVAEHGCHHLLIAHMIEIDNVEKELIDTRLVNREGIAAWFEIESTHQEFLPEMSAILSDVQAVRHGNVH